MDKIEIFFTILITSAIQSTAFPTQTSTDGDHEINELIRSSSLLRDYEYQSNTPRALHDSSDQTKKMKSILEAMMKSKKPARKEKKAEQLNSLMRKLDTGKNGRKKQKTKKGRNVSDQAAPIKSKDDVQSAVSKTEELDEVPEEETTSSPLKEEDLAIVEEEEGTLPKEGNLELTDGENTTLLEEDRSPPMEKNLKSPEEEKPALLEEGNLVIVEEEKGTLPKEGNSEPTDGENETPSEEVRVPPKKKNLKSPEEEKPALPEEEKLVSPKEEKEKADLREPEENSKVQIPLKETNKHSPHLPNQRIDKFKQKKVHFQLPE